MREIEGLYLDELLTNEKCMKREDIERMDRILSGTPFQIRPELRKWRSEVVEDKEVEKGTRTSSQNNALHLWFEQIAEACQKAGIDSKLLMSKTVSVEVNADIIKGMWKTLQKALYGKASTTELKKTGEIEKLQDHIIRFFAEEHNLELPPFPSDEEKTWEELNHRKSSTAPEYPVYTGTPSI